MIQKLNERHREIIRRLVCGETNKEIAAELGLTPEYIGMLKSDPVFQAELQRVREQVHQTFVEEAATVSIRPALQQHAREALDTLVALMRDARSERVRQLSAIDLLDRAGYRPTERIEARHTLEAVDEKTAADIRQAIEDLRKLGHIESAKEPEAPAEPDGQLRLF